MPNNMRAVGTLFVARLFVANLLVASLFFGCLCATLSGAPASAFPDRPIRLLVSFPPGGSTDAMARMVQPGVERLLGQPLVIENRPGAGGLIAIDAVAKSAPDGYVIGLGGTAALGSNAAFQVTTQQERAQNAPAQQTTTQEVRKDVAPVTGLAGSAFILAAPTSFQGKSVRDVIALAKARPDLSLGHGGNGTLMHLTAEMFNQMAGIRLALVPYRGMAPVVTDLIGGHMSFGIIDPPAGMAAIEAGAIKALAVTSTKRVVRLPDIPTVAESGVPDFESNGSFGIVAPAGTPADVIATLNAAFVKVLNDPEIVRRIRDVGAEPLAMTPAEFGVFVEAEARRWLKVTAAGASPK
ncbi:MAG TPA: tripartite tricarboxylate transporter substrate binding protein [Xanthobacteraceae bacterium]|nr:tripartite tricarboxylate transporter substrate binding protein [Xanthobacteraceae bacterium]